MNLRLLFRTGLWLICPLAPSLALAAEDKPLERVPLADGLYTFGGTMANSAALVSSSGVLLIDGGESAQAAAKLQAAIGAITPQPVKLLVNTHWHFDHVNGNGYFVGRGALIAGQAQMRARAATSDRGQNAGPLPENELPAITYASELTLHWAGQEVRLVHPAVGKAHTDGDTVVFFPKADVVHMGDLYFEGMYPYIDVGSGGSAAGMATAIRAVLPQIGEQTKVIPGHGPLATKQQLAAFASMLEDVSGRVQQLIAAGKKLDEVRAAKPTADYDAKWGNGFMKPDGFVELVYRGLGGR